MRNKNKLGIAFLFCIFLFFVSHSNYDVVRAAEKITLTVQESESSTATGPSTYKLYQIAGFSADGKAVTTEDFVGYPVDLEGLSALEWKQAGETLASYALRDRLEPLEVSSTKEAGVYRFPTNQETLAQGIYLLMGSRAADGSSSEPVLVTLPNQTTEKDLLYDVVVVPKFTSNHAPIKKITKKVVVVWDDEENDGLRPAEIEVQLLRNGVLYASIILNKANNWRYEWSNLDSSYNWTVAEKNVPPGFTVSIADEGMVTVITNKVAGAKGSEEVPPLVDAKLPQTGMVWWPIQLMAFAGIVIFLIGWFKHETQE